MPLSFQGRALVGLASSRTFQKAFLKHSRISLASWMQSGSLEVVTLTDFVAPIFSFDIRNSLSSGDSGFQNSLSNLGSLGTVIDPETLPEPPNATGGGCAIGATVCGAGSSSVDKNHQPLAKIAAPIAI